jgi:hypothetical protein
MVFSAAHYYEGELWVVLEFMGGGSLTEILEMFAFVKVRRSLSYWLPSLFIPPPLSLVHQPMCFAYLGV